MHINFWLPNGSQLATSCFKFTPGFVSIGPSDESGDQEEGAVGSSIESGIYSTILLVTGSCKMTANLKTVLTTIEIGNLATNML